MERQGMAATELTPNAWREFLGIGHAAIPSLPGKASELESTREDPRETAGTEVGHIAVTAVTIVPSQLNQCDGSSPACEAGLVKASSTAAIARTPLEDTNLSGLDIEVTRPRVTVLRGTGSSPGQAGSRWEQAVEAVEAPTDALSKHSSFPPERARRAEASRMLPAGCIPAAAAVQSPLQRLGGRWDLRATQTGQGELVKVSWGSDALLSQVEPCSYGEVQPISHVPRAESVESFMLSQDTVDELSSLSSPGTVEGLLASRRGIFEGSPKLKGGAVNSSTVNSPATHLKASRRPKKGFFGEATTTQRGHARGSSSSDTTMLHGAQGPPVLWGGLRSPFKTLGPPRSRRQGASESPTVGVPDCSVRKVEGLKPPVPSSRTVGVGSPRESQMRRRLLKVSSLQGVRASGSPGIFWEGILSQGKAGGAEAGGEVHTRPPSCSYSEHDEGAEDSGPGSSPGIISGDLETSDMEFPGLQTSRAEHKGEVAQIERAGSETLRRLGGRWDVREVGRSGVRALVRVSGDKLLPHGSCLEEDECKATGAASLTYIPTSPASEARNGHRQDHPVCTQYAGRGWSGAPSSECLQDDDDYCSRETSNTESSDVEAGKGAGPEDGRSRGEGGHSSWMMMDEDGRSKGEGGSAEQLPGWSWQVMEEGSALAKPTDSRERGEQRESWASERAGDEGEGWQWNGLEDAFSDMLAQYRKGQGTVDRPHRPARSDRPDRAPVHQLPVGAECGSCPQVRLPHGRLPDSGLGEGGDPRPSPSSGGSMIDASSSDTSIWDIPVN